jgi:integrase
MRFALARLASNPATKQSKTVTFVGQSPVNDFEPVILTLPQVLEILDTLDLMRRTMVITDAATAPRVSEVCGTKT